MSHKSGKLVGLDLEWLKITKVLQNDHQYIQEIRYGHGQVSFVYLSS